MTAARPIPMTPAPLPALGHPVPCRGLHGSAVLTPPACGSGAFLQKTQRSPLSVGVSTSCSTPLPSAEWGKATVPAGYGRPRQSPVVWPAFGFCTCRQSNPRTPRQERGRLTSVKRSSLLSADAARVLVPRQQAFGPHSLRPVAEPLRLPRAAA
jgi:hypothetical protein